MMDAAKLLGLLVVLALLVGLAVVFKYGLPHDDDSIGDELEDDIDWDDAWRDFAPREPWR